VPTIKYFRRKAGGLFFGTANIQNPHPEYFLAGNIFGFPTLRLTANPPIDPGTVLQPDDLRPAGGSSFVLTRKFSPTLRLVEHGDPVHAGSAAQVLAAQRDDRPAAGRRTMECKHWFIDKVHNLYIAPPISARNGRPERRTKLRAGRG